jgi:hypothetical protein
MTLTFGTTVAAHPSYFEAGRQVRSGALVPPDGLEEQMRGRTSIASLLPKTGSVTLEGNASRMMTLSARPPAPIEETLFNVLVGLKVSVSLYAMHLSQDARHKIFDQLDALINPADWYEEDDPPRQEAFQEFLKWLIYAKFFEWTSLGVSDEGHILVAWNTAQTLLTANFGGSGDVRWTARLQSDSGVEHAAGKSSLKFFEKQAQFYLKGG